MIWNKIINMLKPKIKSYPTLSATSNQDTYAYDVQSWNPETHPEGRGRSKLVKDIEYTNGKLDVTYNDGFKAEYDATPQEAKDFVTSDSKGRYALRNLWNRPYKEI